MEGFGRCLLDVHMSRGLWGHQSRLLLRLWWALRANVDIQDALRIDWGAVKILTAPSSQNAADSGRTLCAGAFSTLDAQYRHFGDVSPLCPECGEVDSQWHRISECPRTQGSREDVALSANDLGYLSQNGRWWAEKGLCCGTTVFSKLVPLDMLE